MLTPYQGTGFILAAWPDEASTRECPISGYSMGIRAEMNMRIQLIYSDDCPNVEATRAALLRSLAAENLSVSVEELDVAAPGTPEHLREWGSPTILINGVDVGGENGPTGPCCRLYDGASRRGIPSEAMIVEALRRSRRGASTDLPSP